VLQLLDKLEIVKLEHVPKSANKMPEALANLATTLAQGAKENITILVSGQWVVTPPEDADVEEVKTISVYEIDEEDWSQPLNDYLGHVSQGRQQKSDGEHHVFFIIRGP